MTRRRRIRVPLIRPGYFVWLVIPAALALAHERWGLPHFIWEYTYRAPSGRPHDPYGDRLYFTCTYVGPHGFFRVAAPGGHCPWLWFSHAREIG